MLRAILTGAVVLFPSSAANADDKAIKRELDALRGTWELVSAQRGGQHISKEMKAGFRITFRGNLWLTEFEGRRPFAEGDETITVDPSKSPRQFLKVHKIVIATGMENRESRIELPGIYALDGDTLKLCWAVGGKEARPKEFKTVAGSEHLLLTLKRVKPK